MKICTLQIKDDSYRNSKINIRSCTKDFFPEDSFGGATKEEQAPQLLSLVIEGLDREVKTDIPRNRDGSVRWFFRDRGWVREFIDVNKLKSGNRVIIEKLSKRKYHIYPEKKQFTFIDLFAGIGGIRKGFEFAGGKCVYSSEWDGFE